ncbi:hypothetical protein BOTBODRAFT_56399 [Botryobasidium botryosum FD-172 SS1]|uniref:Uncharacterized protein n=1 Tax=Botryobasidium botryosum (strain FD-172 SS1) TaxID=930990 RepID=A0A067MDU1_BOTB1|nr:hypothetical protein BOTBODRAFT_56399 [Botryobasidium botryosum FD-172 SS1]
MSSTNINVTASDKLFAQFDKDIYQDQIDKGNITQRDLAVLRSIDMSWNYARIGLIAGSLIPSVYGRLIRRPPWPLGRTFGLATLGAVAGSATGQAWKLQYAFRRMQELEDLERFGRALRDMDVEMKRRKGFTVPASNSGNDGLHGRGARGVPRQSPQDPELQRQGASEGVSISSDGAGQDDKPFDDGFRPVKSQLDSDNSSADDSSPQSKSRWSEIRSARPSAQPTSWDTIRQTHEKPNVPSSSSVPAQAPAPSRDPRPSSESPESDANFDPRSSRDQEREQEQLEFNRLLEAERKMTSRGEEGGWSRERWN